MASGFCTGCGKPLVAGAQLCAACGAPVAGGPQAVTSDTPTGASNAPGTPNPSGASPGEVGAPAVPSGPPLGSVLGLEGTRSFLLQHQMLSGGRSYRVLDREKRHLFTVQEDVRNELMANFLRRVPGAGGGLGLGRLVPGSRTFAWMVLDPSGTAQAAISIQMSGNSAVSTLTDASGAPILAVEVQRSFVGGMTATAAHPDGRPLLSAQGNLIRHNFSIKDPQGAEVAKIHEAWASLRDSYNLELVGNTDPLVPLIFAILIDREKETHDAEHHPGATGHLGKRA
jgi:hypothetical protein